MKSVVQPLEMERRDHTPTGRWRMCEQREDEPGAAFALCDCGGRSHDNPETAGHESPTAARNCPVVQERLAKTRRLRNGQMTAAHVDAALPVFGGSIQLQSCSGGLEALWIRLRDDEGREVIYDVVGLYRPPPVRLTPKDARRLADLLRHYADSHKETSE